MAGSSVKKRNRLRPNNIFVILYVSQLPSLLHINYIRFLKFSSNKLGENDWKIFQYLFFFLLFNPRKGVNKVEDTSQPKLPLWLHQVSFKACTEALRVSTCITPPLPQGWQQRWPPHTQPLPLTLWHVGLAYRVHLKWLVGGPGACRKVRGYNNWASLALPKPPLTP